MPRGPKTRAAFDAMAKSKIPALARIAQAPFGAKGSVGMDGDPHAAIIDGKGFATGPTIACLLANALTAFSRQHRVPGA